MNKRIWIEVDLKNLEYNFKVIRNRLKAGCRLLAVVKQNAYGHGLRVIAKYLEKKGVDFLGVNSQEEAFQLLQAKVRTPILVLSNTIFFKNLEYFLKKRVRFTLTEAGLLKSLDKLAKKNNLKALAHIKVDTGMGRLGLRQDQALSFIKKVFSYKNVEVEGLYSHFSSAEEDISYTNYQIRNFLTLKEELKKKGISFKINHLCNSSGFLNFKKAHLDMVRIGLLLYGIKPHPCLRINLKPLLSFKARLIYIKELGKNSFISYANTFQTKRKTLIGIVSCGYAYGYPLSLSNRGEVLIRGKRCKILGRICMDHMIVDLTPVKNLVSLGEEVILIGKEKAQEVTVEELSQKAETIPYQIITNLSSSLQRVYKK
ncbi:MAG TPA: alanine racemase [Candidatus Omnitrophica bacterium]|nr:MAG: alanine racemase [Candidatus Omnitrophota bacterium]RKY34720.1 MAG: alanine racemase [Candidatus Omnitrophota bacterium]RKY43466.1 MAG: alanine racemase [Candidatus Omnitrophota bacterium]HEC69665.1 alanine racemase [Candidatus Omnitrophota bacterium]